MTDTPQSADRDRWPGDVDAPSFRPNPAHARKHIPEEVLADAQNLFETTDLAQAEIARRVGLHRSLLYRTILRKGWRRPDKARVRELIATRLRRRIETELAAAEVALPRAFRTRDPEAVKRAAATIASLMRTLRELQRYDHDKAEFARGPAPEPAVDHEALRRMLADRLERLYREHNGGPA